MTATEIGPRDARAPRTVSFGEAVRYWTRLGFISFGGPAGQIAIMQRDLVERKKWISQTRFGHALSYCMLLPGPEAQQLAIYIGWLLHGTRGGIAAGVLFVLPSVFILWGLSVLYVIYGGVPAVAGAFAGLKPAVLALVAVAMVRMGARLRPRGLALVAAAAFLGIRFLHVPFPWIILGAGIVGFVSGRVWPGAFETGLPGTSESAETDPATEQSRARVEIARSWPRAATVALIGLVLWLAPFLVLVLRLGWSSTPVLQYRFFTQAALVTFGGAYAVLAYVMQAAVQSYHWISSAQAIDGLGLAETTPGPLIMVLQFVGFMTGWNHPDGLSRLAAGSLGAAVTTYVTFLPSFLYIFLGAPHIEGLRGRRGLTSALSGISAAVLGVILNLAVVFGAAVLWPAGFASAPDLFALALAAVSCAALLLFRVEAVWIVVAGGALGLVRALLA